MIKDCQLLKKMCIRDSPSSSDDNYFGYGGLAVDKNNPKAIVVSSLNSWWRCV